MKLPRDCRDPSPEGRDQESGCDYDDGVQPERARDDALEAVPRLYEGQPEPDTADVHHQRGDLVEYQLQPLVRLRCLVDGEREAQRDVGETYHEGNGEDRRDARRVQARTARVVRNDLHQRGDRHQLTNAEAENLAEERTEDRGRYAGCCENRPPLLQVPVGPASQQEAEGGDDQPVPEVSEHHSEEDREDERDYGSRINLMPSG